MTLRIVFQRTGLILLLFQVFLSCCYGLTTGDMKALLETASRNKAIQERLDGLDPTEMFDGLKSSMSKLTEPAEEGFKVFQQIKDIVPDSKVITSVVPMVKSVATLAAEKVVAVFELFKDLFLCMTSPAESTSLELPKAFSEENKKLLKIPLCILDKISSSKLFPEVIQSNIKSFKYLSKKYNEQLEKLGSPPKDPVDEITSISGFSKEYKEDEFCSIENKLEAEHAKHISAVMTQIMGEIISVVKGTAGTIAAVVDVALDTNILGEKPPTKWDNLLEALLGLAEPIPKLYSNLISSYEVIKEGICLSTDIKRAVNSEKANKLILEKFGGGGSSDDDSDKKKGDEKKDDKDNKKGDEKKDDKDNKKGDEKEDDKNKKKDKKKDD